MSQRNTDSSASHFVGKRKKISGYQTRSSYSIRTSKGSWIKNIQDIFQNKGNRLKKGTGGSRTIIRYVLIIGLLILLSYFVWIYVAVASQLPVLTIDALEQGNFSQTSVVTDKNGKPLYKFFDENREFVDFNIINIQAINAFVSIEDQSFWTNGGIDYKGLVRSMRATIKRVFGSNDRIGGASTITQQLLKNILALNQNEKGLYDTIIRKHKERLLVGKLADIIKSDVRKNNPGSSLAEIERKQKEKVLELYLNFIYLGNQTYGIQAASKSYFNKDAQDLSIVESAILASMPQSPSYYDLYKNPDRVMGSLKITDMAGESINTGIVYDQVIVLIGSKLFDTNATISRGSNEFQRFIPTIIPKNITIEGNIYTISYIVGRKDAVMNRMYEDNYITQDELKRSFMDGLSLQLASGKVTITAPHFIFWVRDLILTDERFKNLEIDEDLLYNGGITITTTLDLDIQTIAEKAVRNNMSLLRDRGGTNRSMIHVDSTNGDILAYVGSADYNNIEIQGQNDMIRSKRQPGSSIKPLIYAYLLQTQPITIDTPIYDIPLTLGGFTPNNADGEFQGIIPLKNALAASRNITAIKTYLAGGQEEKLKPFLQNLGMSSLQNNREYGYSLALGAGEVSMLEMVSAYIPLSRGGKTVEINPIFEIRDKNGSILYQKQTKETNSDLLAGPAYLIWNILSNISNMPASWVSSFTVKGLKYAAKSGTSNKVIKEGNKEISYPRDGWLATYTPSRVTMYRGGNTDDKPMNQNAFGLLINSELNKSFYGQMLSNGYITTTDMVRPNDIQSVSISKATGRLANETTPAELTESTLAYNMTIPEDTEYTTMNIDTSCIGIVTPLTPLNQIVKAYVFQPRSITSFDMDNILERHTEQNLLLKDGERGLWSRLLTTAPTEPCEGRGIQETDSIQLSLGVQENQVITDRFTISYTVTSSLNPISRVVISLNDRTIGSYNYNTTQVDDSKLLKLTNIESGSGELQIVAIDTAGKGKILNIPIKLTTSDTDKPFLESSSVDITSLDEGGYTVSMRFTDRTSGIANVTVRLPDDSRKVFQGEEVNFTISTLGTIVYTVIDLFDNTTDGLYELSL